LKHNARKTSVFLAIGGGLQYTQEQLINVAKFSSDDLVQIGNCRQEHNRLGFGYQLAFVRLLNRFPTQVPFELLNDILAYVSIQLCIPSESIDAYNQRQPTISDHQETIRRYLGLIRFAGEAPNQRDLSLAGLTGSGSQFTFGDNTDRPDAAERAMERLGLYQDQTGQELEQLRLERGLRMWGQ